MEIYGIYYCFSILAGMVGGGFMMAEAGRKDANNKEMNHPILTFFHTFMPIIVVGTILAYNCFQPRRADNAPEQEPEEIELDNIDLENRPNNALENFVIQENEAVNSSLELIGQHSPESLDLSFSHGD